jgi:hypothetical protein
MMSQNEGSKVYMSALGEMLRARLEEGDDERKKMDKYESQLKSLKKCNYTLIRSVRNDKLALVKLNDDTVWEVSYNLLDFIVQMYQHHGDRFNRVAAIKAIRNEHGMGLKEAKEIVDHYTDRPKQIKQEFEMRLNGSGSLSVMSGGIVNTFNGSAPGRRVRVTIEELHN